MSLHHDLLEQAAHLASRERNRPRQASLRRAVSAAYYAMFHFLTGECSKRFAPAQPRGLREQMQRALSHTGMNEVCRQFARDDVRQLPLATRLLMRAPLNQHLVSVAAAFVELQDARYRADYDVSAQFSRAETKDKITLVSRAFSNWPSISADPNTTAFLAALLFQKTWRT